MTSRQARRRIARLQKKERRNLDKMQGKLPELLCPCDEKPCPIDRRVGSPDGDPNCGGIFFDDNTSKGELELVSPCPRFQSWKAKIK